MQGTDHNQSAVLMTSEELRMNAFSKSNLRGGKVAKRRIARRWVTWILWAWVLPIIGLLTVFIAAAGMTSVNYFGSEKAFNSTQTWLFDRFGIEQIKPAKVNQDMNPQVATKEVLPDNSANISNLEAELMKSVDTVTLQLDRSLTIKKLNDVSPVQPATATHHINKE